MSNNSELSAEELTKFIRQANEAQNMLKDVLKHLQQQQNSTECSSRLRHQSYRERQNSSSSSSSEEIDNEPLTIVRKSSALARERESRRHQRSDRKRDRSRSRGRSRGHSRGRSHGRSRSRSHTNARRSQLALAVSV